MEREDSGRDAHGRAVAVLFVLVAVVGLSVQLHLCALLLVFSAVFLWLRGYWKPDWAGVALGTVVTIGALSPFFLLAAEHSGLMPIHRDPVGLGLARFSPVVKGIVYWFRYASLFCSSQSMYTFDFAKSLAAPLSVALYRFFVALSLVLGTTTIVIPILANAWSWRRQRKTHRSRVPREQTDRRSWLRGYSLWTLVACIVANALSPAPTMWWHNLIALHAAVLPVVLWVGAMLRTRRMPLVRRGLGAYLLLTLVLLLGMAIGSEQFVRDQALNLRPASPAAALTSRDALGLPYHRAPWPRTQMFFYQTYMLQYEIPAQADPNASESNTR